jgi:uncharacterized repeat protein (TIGR01451 family)
MLSPTFRRPRWAPFAAIVLAIAGLAFCVPAAVAQQADLSVTKSGPATAAAGSDVTYTITVANFGPDSADNAGLTDNIPGGMTFVSLSSPAGWNCTTPNPGDPGAVACTTASLAAGGNALFSLTVHIPSGTPPGTTFTNVASVTSNTFDPSDENNSGATATSVAGGTSADMTVAKTGPGSAPPNTDVTYTITLTNAGPDAATSVALNDTLPGTMTFVSLTQNAGPTMSCSTPAVGAGGTVTCTLATFPAGTTANFSLTGHIPPGTSAGTEFQSIATVSSDNDPTAENNASTVTTIVSAADLAIVKAGPASVAHGQNITYTIAVSNSGPDAAVDVVWLDTLTNVTFVSLTQNTGPAFSCTTAAPGSSGTINCSTAVLASGASAQFTLVVNSGSDPATTRSNTASVSSSSGDPNTGNNSSTATTTLTAAADLTISKSGPATASQGGEITYTITAGHAGGSSAANVSVTDALPPGVAFRSLSAPSGWTCTTPAVGQNGTITCTRASFAFGQSGVFTLAGTVTAAVGAGLSNTATIASSTPDPNGANNSATTNATVTPPVSDLTITKTHSGNAQRGAPLPYTITVRNVGGAPTSGTVTVTDTLPAGLTAASISGAGWGAA